MAEACPSKAHLDAPSGANPRWPSIDWSPFPGAEHVRSGLAQIKRKQLDLQALTVLLAKSRLEGLGFSIDCHELEATEAHDALYERLTARYGDEAHARFNAIRREMVSFAEAFDGAIARAEAE